MRIIKLNATDSTNTYLKNLVRQNQLDDFTTVVTLEQSKGKGQMGASWEAEPGKNLTFSTLKKFDDLSVTDGFLLNSCASIAISNALKRFSIPNLHVKWPNDILSGSSKICGILIENLLVGSQIQSSILGIGLNVNQQTFNNLSNASSLKLLLGRTLNLEELLFNIVKQLKINFAKIEANKSKELWDAYVKTLFRKDKPSTFKDATGLVFMGFIRTISPQGKLVVALEDDILKEFDLKEIQLLY